MMYIIPDDIWNIIKVYLLHRKFDAIKIIKYHTELPYALGMHNRKGIDNNISYLTTFQPWVFKILCKKQIINIIKKTEENERRNYM
jgi:hypothetical protein